MNDSDQGPVRGFAVAVLLAAGCAATDPDFDLDVELEREVWTTAKARFVLPEGAEEARVEFGEDGAFDRSVEADPSPGAAEVLLFGLPAGTTVEARVVAVVDGAEEVGEPVVVDVPPAPSELPGFEVEGDLPAGGFLVTTFVGQPPIPVVLDARGRLRWWSFGEAGTPGQPVVARTLLSADGEGALFLEFSTRPADPSEHQGITRVALDGSALERDLEPALHHDFVEMPDGTLAAIAFVEGEVDGQAVYGDGIAVRGDDGEWRIAWSVWDEEFLPLVPVDDYSLVMGWSHANALDYLPDEDAWLIGISRFRSIWKVDRATGEVVERIGGAGSDWRDPHGGTELLRRAHQFDLEGDRLLVFDNGEEEDLDSYAVEYRLDRDTMTATEVWRYALDPPQFVTALGDASQLPDGSRLVVWSNLGLVEVVTQDGEVPWRLSTDVGAGIGYATWIPSLDDR